MLDKGRQLQNNVVMFYFQYIYMANCKYFVKTILSLWLQVLSCTNLTPHDVVDALTRWVLTLLSFNVDLTICSFQLSVSKYFS